MRLVVLASVWLCLLPACPQAAAGDASFPEVTNVSQLPALSGLNLAETYVIHLEGDVLWVDGSAGKMVLEDNSGMAVLEIDLRGQQVSAGLRVRLTGKGTITRASDGYRLGVNGVLIDNDGIHSMREKSAPIYLPSGRHPLRLEWFNQTAESGLEVEYSGPDIARARIPDAVLFKIAKSAADNASAVETGLNYECFAVTGDVLPNGGQQIVLKSGWTDNFDINVRSRADHIGLRFTGYLAVAREGLYRFYLRSDDGSRLFIDAPSLRLQVVGKSPSKTPTLLSADQPVGQECQWAQVSGTVAFVNEAQKQMELELRSRTGRMRVRITDPTGLSSNELMGRRVRATGVCVCAYTLDGQRVAGQVLVSDSKQIELLDANPTSSPSSNGLPLLTTAAEVHQLKREEALRQSAVSIRGVVTCVLPDVEAVTIQDSSRGFYAADFSTNRSRLPDVGSLVEVNGTTDAGFFAPVVNATELRELGPGELPEPVRPTWDQLINGSLDAQYVELQGIITAVNTNSVTLRTRQGSIKMELRLRGMENSDLTQFENSLVRVRGCLLAYWNYLTHQVKAGEVRLYGATICVDQPPPDDLFSTRKKTFGELLLFDPTGGAFERVKVAGQVIYALDTECFLTDGKSGLRIVAGKPLDLSAGDLVDVVGFSDLSGESPTLREAVARKTGHASLPPATVLANDDLLDGKCDATRVQVRGKLVSIRRTHSEQLLEVQTGPRTFVARIPGSKDLNGSLTPGCQVELEGVYCGLGGNKAVGQEITSFELLLNEPADIKILARPPWWTLKRLLVAVGALVSVLAATLVWIKQLQRQVEERTRQLEKQIRERERVEQQRAMEQERARIAQDLHDDLGAGLTEISVLGKQARSRVASEEQRCSYLRQMDESAQHMFAALDEIVWAMSPAHDSLDSLVSYFCLHAERFLGTANIGWRLEGAAGLPDMPVNSLCRHELFLAFKEALTNIVRHSGATEARLGFRLEKERLVLTVADNGRGIGTEARSPYSDGLANMRGRMEKLKGQFELSSRPGQGTTVLFSVPMTN